mmetsp:Transcript_27157/g.39952  ORF Transcript_27157/g.39952 Transcript_27157/m.39952 type:complete len:181 (-) Transcript_27157:178-720(-)
MKKETEEFGKTCKQHQENKITTSKKYGKVPVKEYENPEPFEYVHLDSVGTWTICVHIGNKIVKVCIWALTMCDAASSWVEFARLEGSSSYEAAIQFNSHWLCCYPRPKACIFDNGSEFKAEFLEMLQSYGIKKLPTAVKNPRANSVVERVHLILAEMFRVTEFQGKHWRREVDRILQATA